MLWTLWQQRYQEDLLWAFTLNNEQGKLEFYLLQRPSQNGRVQSAAGENATLQRA